jgi:hypothetical protein
VPPPCRSGHAPFVAKQDIAARVALTSGTLAGDMQW